MKKILIISQIAIGFVLGWLIWAMSVKITGHIEPWDSDLPIYSAYLVISGFLTATIEPKYFWIGPVFIYFGQLVFTVFSYNAHGAVILPPFISLLIFGSVQGFVGAGIGFVLRNRKRSPKQNLSGNPTP